MGAGMDARARNVLDAADAWFAANQTMRAADEEWQRRRDAEQDALDTAEVELAAAVMAWRAAGRPE